MIEQTTTEEQRTALGYIAAVLKEYEHKKDKGGLRTKLEELGFPVYSRRVTWPGGIGTYQVMRGGILRVQVLASTWGYKKRGATIAKGAFVQGATEFGYKYAPCVEVLKNGNGNYISYYHTGARPPMKHPHPLEKKHTKIYY